MRTVTVFNSISLDGYFTDAKNDMSWAHAAPDDMEWNAFVSGNASGGGALMLGRVTYQMMANFWPTLQAAKAMPAVAEGMNRKQKYLFSRTLKEATWSNSTLLIGNPANEVAALKNDGGDSIVILGSGKVVAQLADANLIDEYQFVVVPIALGGGRTLFDDVTRPIPLELLDSRTFKNGNIFSRYKPR